MLKINAEITHKIIRYTPDTEKNTINVEVATGAEIDGVFTSDGRDLIKHTIKNIPDRQLRQVDILTVDAFGQVTLPRMPVDNNPIEIDGAAQDHITGQVIACVNNSEGDSITTTYYYAVAGRDWFNEAAAFRQVDHPECTGMNDYEYNSRRIWSILLEMGLVSGDIV